MASRILLLCLAILTIHNCNGYRWDYILKTWDNQKRDDTNTVTQRYHTDPTHPTLEPPHKGNGKRASDETDYQGIRLNDPKFKQDLLAYIVATSKDEMWPCYCKTMI